MAAVSCKSREPRCLLDGAAAERGPELAAAGMPTGFQRASPTGSVYIPSLTGFQGVAPWANTDASWMSTIHALLD
jgi:hypothetical protein